MPYTSNPHIGKVRAYAVMLVQKKGWSIRKVARHIGVAPSTVSRWMKRAESIAAVQGGHVPSIPTQSSRPKTSPSRIDPSVVKRIIALRIQHNRCAPVIRSYLKREGIHVSQSTIERVLKRQKLIKERSKWKKHHRSTPRPPASAPGQLVQMDTIHLMKNYSYLNRSYEKFYIYTLIDCYSRLARINVAPLISAKRSIEVIKTMRYGLPFSISTLQTDHGPEFSKHVVRYLTHSRVTHRYTRIRQPNDNAHIERFNRTLQEECSTDIYRYRHDLDTLQIALYDYQHYYNHERLHIGLNYDTPMEVLRRS